MRSGAVAIVAALAIVLDPGIAQADPSGSQTGVYGDPAAAAPYWAAQSLEDNCGAMSVADIVGELTGKRPTEAQILTVAEQTPSEMNPGTMIYKPNTGGISVGDLPTLFKHYGITAVNSDTSGPEATGLNALEQYLGAGRKVIAFVNYAIVEDSSDQRTAADHFVVVTGVSLLTAVGTIRVTFVGTCVTVSTGTCRQTVYGTRWISVTGTSRRTWYTTVLRTTAPSTNTRPGPSQS